VEERASEVAVVARGKPVAEPRFLFVVKVVHDMDGFAASTETASSAAALFLRYYFIAGIYRE